MTLQITSTSARMSALVLLLLATALLGCQESMMDTTRLAPCTTVGQQCDLGNGVLGVCFDAPCPTGHSLPCFTCAKQH
jgi:hypothetical protein